MVLVWNNVQSFQRHLEAMKNFRRSHGAGRLPGLTIRDMPTPYDIGPRRKDRLVPCFTDSRGRLILVPMWKISLSHGSRN